jgi:FdhD protein
MKIVRWDGETAREFDDEVAAEEPLEIRVQGQPISVTMRTPGHDAELAAGFLLTEGLIQNREDLLSVRHCAQNPNGNVIRVSLGNQVPVDLAKLTRHVFASSSCGLCGKATIESIHRQFQPVVSKTELPAAILATMAQTMRDAQPTFDRTGGLHAAALFDTNGRLVALREDVGRHNAVDKLLGHCFLDRRTPTDQDVLVVSGRSSFEIMQKSLAARIPIVASVSAPTSLAVQFAQESGQTLIGFLRPGRMNIYSHPWRIV